MSGSTLTPPLLSGRAARIVLGVACFAGVAFVPLEGLNWIWIVTLVLGGLSLFLGGLLANPGCELTALPNLLLPKRYRLHFF